MHRVHQSDRSAGARPVIMAESCHRTECTELSAPSPPRHLGDITLYIAAAARDKYGIPAGDPSGLKGADDPIVFRRRRRCSFIRLYVRIIRI